MSRKIHILHFNDVYHPDDHENRCDRAASFLARIEEKDVSDLDPIVVFSGDFVGPSLMSTFTKGKHMMEVLEILGVDVGTVGNHEFDFGVENFRHMVKDSCLFDGVPARSIWVSTNIDGKDGEPIPGCERYKLLERHGIKIGILGLSENWLSDAGLSPTTSNPDCYALWNEEIERGRKFSQILREQGAQIVLALVHSLAANTAALADALRPHVDFVLGGHEHIAAPEDPAKEGWIISGFDFEEFSMLSFDVPAAPAPLPPPSVRRVSVSADPPASPSPRVSRLRSLIARYHEEMKSRLGEEIGSVSIPLDCRKFKLRTQVLQSRRRPLHISLSTLSLCLPALSLQSTPVSSHRLSNFLRCGLGLVL
jgi:5'-nucleotidase